MFASPVTIGLQNENELAFYKDWIAESKESGRPYIYGITFVSLPKESLIQDFNVFPGFNVRARIKSDKDVCPRWCERNFPVTWNQEQLDFYATMKLYDDA